MLPEPLRVKICCIRSRSEARLALGWGASALGLVSAMPSGPGVIPESEIARITAIVPPAVGSFLLTSSCDARTIVAQQRRCRVNTLQLCDLPRLHVYSRLRHELPGISIVQVIHVTGEESLKTACRVAPLVDALLLDSGNPNLKTKELGGTGRVHDWTISCRIRERVLQPVFLAGGLNAHNVRQAVRTVRPFGVDLCSGVRSHNQLDREKLARFFEAVREIQ